MSIHVTKRKIESKSDSNLTKKSYIGAHKEILDVNNFDNTFDIECETLLDNEYEQNPTNVKTKRQLMK